MAFKLKSGNKTNFKSMGASPFKDMKTGSYKHSFESPAKHKDKVNEGSNLDPKYADAHNKRHAKGATHGKIGSKDNKWNESEQSPAKQQKGTEGQDQNKIFDNKGTHVGNYVNDKKVMFTQDQIEDAAGVTTNVKIPKVMKDGPKNKVHGVKNPGNWQPHPNVFKTKKSPAKQTKDAFKDGSKKSARDKFNDKETAAEIKKNGGRDNQKSPYWYKIDGKKATRAQYIKYKNVPGNMEGGGKQTNDPDVYGRKANNHGRGPKTK